MVDQDITTFFNRLYDDTYLKVIKYVTVKCSNPEDIADIVQEIYTEAYSVLLRKGTNYIDNGNAFIMHLAKSKVYKHYSLAEKVMRLIPLSSKHNGDSDVNLDETEEFEQSNIEDEIITQDLVDSVWLLLKKKPKDVQRVFYLYYYCDMSLREIASELKLSESNVKHKLYRTLKEIRLLYKKGGEAL